jgi:hypothetical protein
MESKLGHYHVVRLVERSLSIAVVTHLRQCLYAINRRQGAIPESGHTILLTSSEKNRTGCEF